MKFYENYLNSFGVFPVQTLNFASCQFAFPTTGGGGGGGTLWCGVPTDHYKSDYRGRGGGKSCKKDILQN